MPVDRACAALRAGMDTYHLDPQRKCVLCNYELGEDPEREIIRIESGELRVGSKSGRLCFYVDDDSTISFFHCDCILTRMDFTREAQLDHCGMCQTKLQHELVVFRMMLGTLEGDEFAPFMEDQNIALLCRECMLESIGEGDYEAGELILVSAA